MVDKTRDEFGAAPNRHHLAAYTRRDAGADICESHIPVRVVTTFTE